MSKDRAQAALDAARRFASEGKFRAALEKHIWFHNHALKIRKSYYGVRLSFALGDWMELAQKYPPALGALVKIRDKKTARLLRGKEDRALFHDVESINHRLKESAATVALFKTIDKVNERFASAIYELADEALISAGEYVLARKHLGDPAMRFQIAKCNFEDGMQFAETSKCIEVSKRAFAANFVGDVVRLIIVLDKAGELRVARQYQSKALKLLNDKVIRNAIKHSSQARSKADNL